MTAIASQTTATDDRDALPVLISGALRPGFDRADLSCYGDPSWDLSPGVFRDNARRCHVTVHFGGIEDPAIADALRQFLHARLNTDLPGHSPTHEPQPLQGAAQNTIG